MVRYLRYNIGMKQVQLKISLSEKLNQNLCALAAELGIPTTQFVKYLIINHIEKRKELIPSDRTIQKTLKALKDIETSTLTSDVSTFMDDL